MISVKMGNKNNPEEFSPTALLLSSSQAIVEEIATNDACIGYFGMGYIDPKKTKALALAGKDGEPFYEPNEQNVLQGKYPLSRPLFMYTNADPEGVVKIFMDFVVSPLGQKAFQDTGFIPLHSNGSE